MTDDTIAPVEPQEIDEQRSLELRQLSTAAGLRGSPSGGAQCGDCVYYLENTADVSYCWHPKLRILVGADWSCAWWERVPPE